MTLVNIVCSTSFSIPDFYLELNNISYFVYTRSSLSIYFHCYSEYSINTCIDLTTIKEEVTGLEESRWGLRKGCGGG